MKIAVETHGCRLNQAEADAMELALIQAGHEIVGTDEAELLVLNSCTITHNADSDARQRVRAAHRASPDQAIVLTGCFANSAPEEAAALPGVTLVAGNDEKDQIAELIASVGRGPKRGSPLVSVRSLTRKLKKSGRSVGISRKASGLGAKRSHRRSRALLKIQDGCNYSCTFCIVPQVRGANRSYSRELLRERFLGLQAQPSPEVVLTGVHLGTYGWDFQEKDGLERLLQDLLETPGEAWLRLGSLDPHEVRPGLVELLARYGGKRLCRHLHLPVQSGSDKILASMRRAHRSDDLRAIIPKLREASPGLAIGTDFIVGFPGETQADFDESYSLFESLGLDYAHVFTYSKRAGTAAAVMPDQVDESVKRTRNRQFRELSKRNWRAFAQRLEGQELSAVSLARSKASAFGYALTDNYQRVRCEGSAAHVAGSRVRLRIVGLDGHELVGQVLA